jgi:ABC-2 type transport system permease protein
MIGDLGVVFAAELLRRIRSRIFVMGLAIGVLMIVAFMKLPEIFAGSMQSSSTIVIVADPAIAAHAKTLLSHDYTVAATLPPQPVTAQLLRAHGAAAALVLTAGSRGLSVHIYARDPSAMSRGQIRRDLFPLELGSALHQSAQRIADYEKYPIGISTIDSKFASSEAAQAAQGVAYTLIFFLYILILMNSQFVMTSVAEEKTSRIAELLVASVSPSVLLVGKVGAGAVLAFVQLAVWIGAGLLISGGSPPPNMSENPFSLGGVLDVLTPGVLIAFLLFFVLGFLQVSTMLAAFASLVNRTEDLGGMAMPVILPIVAALMISLPALASPDAPWAVGFSFVPLFAPFVMFARIAVSDVPLWQVLTSLAINVAAVWLIAIFGGKLYRVGMLLYGRTPKFGQILTIMRSN